MSKYINGYDTYYITNSQFILATKSRFILAIDNNNIKEIESIPNYNGQTPFFIACKNGFSEIAKYLATLDYIDLHQKNDTGLAPIHLVCKNGNVELLDLFLNNSSLDNVVSIPTKRSPYGLFAVFNKLSSSTPLYIAVSNNHFLTAEKLLKNKSDPNIQDPSGSTTLHISTNNKNLKISRLLLDYRANPNLKNIHGETALHIAMKNLDFRIIKLLLENEADIEIHDNHGDLPLKTPLQSYRLDILELAFQYTDKVNFQDKQGKTYLHVAVMNDRTLIVDFLIKNKANIYLSDHKGCNNLHYSHKNLPLFKFFCHQGLDIKLNDNHGSNPIHWATSSNSIEVVEFLIQNKIDVNLKDDQGESPLSIASRFNFYELVTLLVNNKAKMDIYNKQGDTPLYIAVSNYKQNDNTIKIVELLIKHGADVHMFYTSSSPDIDYFLNLGKFVSILFEEELDSNQLKDFYKINGLALLNNMDEEYYKNREDNMEFIVDIIKTKVYKSDTVEKIQQYSRVLVKNFKILGLEDCISVNCQFVFKFETIPLKVLSLLPFHKYILENSSIKIAPLILNKINSFNTLKEFIDPNFDLFKPLFEEFWPQEMTTTGNTETEN